MTMGPCHLYFVVTDSAGNQSHSCKVDVVYPGTTTPVTEALFADEAMLTPVVASNLTVPGIVSLWTSGPLRVDLLVRSFDVGNQNILGLDFLYPPEASITSGSRISVSGAASDPGDVLLIDTPGAASFQPVDIISGHHHLGRDPLVVSTLSIGTGPGDPFARTPLFDQILGDIPLSRVSATPAHGPGSTILGSVKRPFSVKTPYWPLASGSGATTVPAGDATSYRNDYDPAGLGDSVSIGRDVHLFAGRQTLIGAEISAGMSIDIAHTPPSAIPGEGVGIGRVASFDPAATYVGASPDNGSYSRESVILGYDTGYNFDTYTRKATVIGSRVTVANTAYEGNQHVVGDTLVGHLNAAGASGGYDTLWGITTLLSADQGFSGGTLGSPDGPTTTVQPNNDSWLFNERFATWLRLGLTVNQAYDAAADITRNTIVRRKIDAPPAADNFDRTDWTNWNLAAHNVFSRIQPIADTADYENGLVLLTVPDPVVPGSLQIDGSATLGSPHHDGAGGAPGALGFYGATAVARSVVPSTGGIPALNSLIDALGNLGLVITPSVPVVHDPYNRDTFTLDQADTGQAPVGFPFNDSNIGSRLGVARRISTTGTPSGSWVPVVYYTDLFDVYAQVVVDTWHPTGNSDGLFIRVIPSATAFVSSGGRALEYGIRATHDGLYLHDTGGVALLSTYSTNAVDGDTLRIEAVARAITVKVNGSTVATHTMPDDLGGRMHGLSMMDLTTMHDLYIGHP